MYKSHLIKVKYLGPTNTKGSRVQLSTSDLSYHGDRDKTLTIPFNYESSSTFEQARAAIALSGLTIRAYGEDRDYYYVVCDWNYDLLAALFKVTEVRGI